ncbi:hypothetical protein TSUD_409620 [Trifolium subterraneum]|uniref:3'-5' exonuclease domain-containing protein n=1 Tax=Trifolium subterraneum TaxID=3900 RepID=A0A2Z6PU36_TRISU|nr:hypothetical protein TSUD_409620 [Trifolium subterraneum]
MPSIVNSKSFNTHDVYTVNLNGNEIKVTVTAVSSVVRKWLQATLYLRRRYIYKNRLIVGLGVNWTPGAGIHDPPADTLQICIGRRCLIFQLTHATFVPKNLRDFLKNPDHIFVGFWNNSDRRKLESSDHDLKMEEDPLDMRHYAVAKDPADNENLRRASVNEIVEKCLGYEIEQSGEIARSDWNVNVLSDEQVVYASVDAYCAFCIGKNVRIWRFT